MAKSKRRIEAAAQHQHAWGETRFDSGRKGRRAGQSSDGARCTCGLTAKAPTKPTTAWRRAYGDLQPKPVVPEAVLA